MKIAVIICGLAFDSQKATMKGIERRVRDLGDICSVFCCYLNVSGNETYTTGEYMIFELPDFKKFDGVIFVRNTFQNVEAEQRLFDKIKEAGVPCVCADRYHPDYLNLTTDESGSLYELTNHLIEVHKAKSFFFVSGPKGIADSALRYDGFKRAIEEHNIDFDESMIFEGNFEYESGVRAANYFMNCNKPMADAIVCSNDQMAVGVMNELKRNQIKVPKDVRVTGVDFDYVSRIVSPRLTTVKRQQYQKGYNSVDLLHDYVNHEKGENTVSPILLSIGETCGCKTNNEGHADVDESLAIDIYRQAELSKMVKCMTADLMTKNDRESLIAETEQYALALRPKELYICINNRTEHHIEYTDFADSLLKSDVSKEEKYTDQMINVIAIVNGESVPIGTNNMFATSDLLPPAANGGREGVTYYFLPIHYLNRNFGYAVLGETGELARNDFFSSWVSTVSNAFENTRKQTLLTQMIKTLDKMWIYDTLTGLFNRAGFFKMSESVVQECVNNRKPVCVVFLDVDGLKEVNDKFGHDEGDCLIKAAASALKEVKHHGEILMRYGGDEFVLLSTEFDEAAAQNCIDEIEKKMNECNEAWDKPYDLEASIGFCITTPESKDKLTSIIEEADHEMYKKKYVKKALRRRIY